MAGKNVLQVSEGSFNSDVVESDTPVVLDFWAPWCRPCLQIGPLVEQLADKYEGQVRVGKVNVDENQALAQKYRIISIPALVAFKNGEEVDRIVGASPAKINELFKGLA